VCFRALSAHHNVGEPDNQPDCFEEGGPDPPACPLVPTHQTAPGRVSETRSGGLRALTRSRAARAA
jgi:hypothetical protein